MSMDELKKHIETELRPKIEWKVETERDLCCVLCMWSGGDGVVRREGTGDRLTEDFICDDCIRALRNVS